MEYNLIIGHAFDTDRPFEIEVDTHTRNGWKLETFRVNDRYIYQTLSRPITNNQVNPPQNNVYPYSETSSY